MASCRRFAAARCPSVVVFARVSSVLVVLLLAAAAKADNPVDRDNEKLAERAQELGKKPEGVLPLLELIDHWDDSSPGRL